MTDNSNADTSTHDDNIQDIDSIQNIDGTQNIDSHHANVSSKAPSNVPSITLKNFKSYKNATLPLAPLTLLIGANASGKSNVIESLRFLSWVAGGERLTTLKNRVNDSDKVLRGRFKNLVRADSDEFVLSFNSEHHLIYEGVFKVDTHKIELVNETIETAGYLLYVLKDIYKPYFSHNSQYLKQDIIENWLSEREEMDGDDGQVTTIQSEERGFSLVLEDKDLSILSDILNRMPLLDWFESKSHYSQVRTNIQLSKAELTEFVFFDFIPSVMNQMSFRDYELYPDGSNLAGVMYQLCEDNPDNKTKLLTIIQSLPEQHISDIIFYPDRRGRVEFALVESYGNSDNSQSNECPMDLLSDGTLKALAIATALLSVPERATLVIEEIDNSIHPSRANDMLSLMRHIATERKLKLLLSTHNPALMDALPDQALADVVFCYRDPKEGDSRLTRLGDLEDYVGLMVQGSLGDLVTEGVVERFVKYPTTSEERKQKMSNWLKRMRGQ